VPHKPDAMTSLDIALLYLLAAVLGVVACRQFKLPPMLGYLVAGVLIGPNALALAQSSAASATWPNLASSFLMFVIGLEFSLPKLRAMKQHVFGLGLSQVTLTIVLATSARCCSRGCCRPGGTSRGRPHWPWAASCR
jgi:CPA2 family monovalent cation:H+ antiporter-2